MAIGPIELTGMVTRSQDISLFKQNEDNKPMIDQSNIQVNIQKKAQEQNHQVTNAEKSEYLENRFDAKEQGNGAYQQNRNKKKKDEKPEEGIFKKATSGFDMRI